MTVEPDIPDTSVAAASRGRNIFTDTVLIATLPMLAYGLSYVYEMSYFASFGIPTSLIALGLSDIVVRTVVIVVSSAMLLWAARWIRSQGEIAKVIAYMVTFFGPPGYSLIHPHISFSWSVLLAASLLLMVSSDDLFVDTPITVDKRVREGWLDWLFRRLAKTFDRTVAHVILWLAATTMVVACVGHFEAASSVHFLVLAGGSDQVVLRCYGDRLVCARFDRALKAVLPVFRIRTTIGDSAQALTLETLGRLTPATPDSSEASRRYLTPIRR